MNLIFFKSNRPELNANGTRKSRDEKKAEELEIPFTLDQIVFTPVDDFNEMLSHVTLTSEQQLLIKDIRRRGKNKVSFTYNVVIYKLDILLLILALLSNSILSVMAFYIVVLSIFCFNFYFFIYFYLDLKKD